MIEVLDHAARGRTQVDWLDSRHTFSFAGFHDPERMGFRALRVINEDRVLPGAGFPPHGHRDMEIISYVLKGALEHRDSLGNGSIIRPGEVQRMSAGTGIRHSEYNASRKEPVHFLQVWILPGRAGLAPGYEQKQFPAAGRRGRWRLVGDPEGREGAVTIHQDARLYVADLAPGEVIGHVLAAGRGAFLQVARGAVTLDGHALEAGDGAAIVAEDALRVEGRTDAELLLFDLG